MASFHIRQARSEDADPISRLIMGLTPYFLADSSSPEAKPFLDTLTPSATEDRINAPNFTYLVAEDSAGLCGFIALRDGAHLYHLFVRSDAHRRGIARALWERIGAGSDSRVFTVNATLSAVPAYEHLGFVAKAAPKSADGLVFVPMEYTRGS